MKHAVLAALSLAAFPAVAAPQVVTDIHPVNLIVSAVMDGAGAPTTLLPPNASPHHFSLSPSQAQALQEADVVVWVGPELTPSLDSALQTLGREAVSLSLLNVRGTPVLMSDHDHGERADHDDHDEEHDHSDDHADHAEEAAFVDPHAWLDPVAVANWSTAIADVLAGVDPDNAAFYAANAEKLTEEMTKLDADIRARMANTAPSFVLAHDALGYFEARFDAEPAAILTDTEDAAPGPQAIDAAQSALLDGAACFLVEPSTPQRTINAVRGRSDAEVVEIDPLGVDAESIGEIIDSIAVALERC